MGIGAIIAMIAAWLLPKVVEDPIIAAKAIEKTGQLLTGEGATDIIQSVGAAVVANTEAKSANFFVAGARPCILWICAIAYAWQFVLLPIIGFFLALCGVSISGLPSLPMDQIMPVLFGILGLGGLHAYENIKGVSK